MTNQVKQVEKVTDVIQVLHAGIGFYEDAMKEVDNMSVKSTFSRMVENKEKTIAQLQPLAIAEQGDVEKGSSWAVEARKMYTKIASSISSNQDFTFVNQLEEVEDKVLEVLDEAMGADQPAAAMATLRAVKAEAQSLHDEMKALQETMKH